MKKIHVAFVGALAAGALFSVAHADDLVSAKLTTPISAPAQAIAGGVVFNCAGDTCSTGDANGDWSIAGCRQLARAVGPVASYGTASHPLSADKLQQCNKAAKPVAEIKGK